MTKIRKSYKILSEGGHEVTWGEFIRLLKKKGIKLKEHEKKHDLYWNPNTGAEAEIPRHPSKEAPNGTVKSILKKLGI